jgi:hypothetical protein
MLFLAGIGFPRDGCTLPIQNPIIGGLPIAAKSRPCGASCGAIVGSPGHGPPCRPVFVGSGHKYCGSSALADPVTTPPETLVKMTVLKFGSMSIPGRR